MMISFVRFWVPVIIYAALIYFLSAISSVHTPLSGWNFDKVLHFLEYSPFGFLICRALIFGSSLSSKKGAFLLSLLFIIIYSASDEWHQSWVPGRDANIIDLLADIAGGTAGAYLFFNLLNKQKLPKG